MIQWARIFAYLIGGLTLLWQGSEVLNGRLLNQFLIADIILGILLITAARFPNQQNAALALFAAYAYSVGVFMVVTTGGLLLNRYDFGAFTTTSGLIPCTIFSFLLSRWLLVKPQN